MSDRIHTFLFKAWQWYAKRVLKIPFVLQFTPPPGDRIMGVTFAWSMEYRDAVKNCFISVQQAQALEMQLRQSIEIIDGLKSGNRGARRTLNRAVKKAVSETKNAAGGPSQEAIIAEQNRANTRIVNAATAGKGVKN